MMLGVSWGASLGEGVKCLSFSTKGGCHHLSVCVCVCVRTKYVFCFVLFCIFFCVFGCGESGLVMMI